MKNSILALLFILLAPTLASAQLASEFENGDEVDVGKMTEIILDHNQDREPDVAFKKIRGDVQFKFYKNEDDKRVLVICPQSSKKPIEITLWLVWFEEKAAFQLDLELIPKGGAPPPVEDPSDPIDSDPPVEDSFLREVTALSKRLADDMFDDTTRSGLKATYTSAYEAVKSSGTLVVSAFGEDYRYDMSDMDKTNSYVIAAVSKTISYAKSKDKVSDSKDWYEGFRKPINEKTKEYPTGDRAKYAQLLKAIAEGL